MQTEVQERDSNAQLSINCPSANLFAEVFENPDIAVLRFPRLSLSLTLADGNRN